MFHWICPECGREIPPTERECQACDPNAVVSPSVETAENAPVAQVLSVAPPVVEAPAAQHAPQPLLLAAAPAPIEAPPAPEVIESAPVANDPESTPTAEIELPVAPVAALAQADPEPAPVATIQPTVEPVIETTAIAEVAHIANPEREPRIEPSLVAATEPTIDPVAETAPVVPASVVEIAQVAPPEAAPIADAIPVADPEPLPVVEPPPVALNLEPVVEAAPVQDVAQVPPLESAPIADAVHVAEPLPVAEGSQIAKSEPAIEPVVETAPVADVAPVPEVEPQVAAPLAEGTALSAAEESPAPLVEDVAISEPQATPVAAAPVPVVDLKPAEPEPPAAPAPIKVHEMPDPFLALAEEIRAVQAARAAALAAPVEGAGLLELVEAVGTVAIAPAETPVLASALTAPTAPVSAPIEAVATAEAAVPAETANAVALLEPPQSETTLLTTPEPAAHVASQPVALAPEPQPQPAAFAPVAEPEGPTLPLAPMQNYTPATSRSIRPVPPRVQILSADSGPRITLPGPTLPPQLTRLQDANVVTVMGEPTAELVKEVTTPKKSAGAPGWVVSLGVMLLLLAAGLGIVFYLMPRTVADAKPGPTPAEAATATASTGPASPLAKFIEVTGFRIVVDGNKKSEVEYLVINHSAADISDANIFITLRNVKPGQPPVCRFSFKVPSLAPFESKEMSSPIEKTTRAVTLPDWQDLRADVQISQ